MTTDPAEFGRRETVPAPLPRSAASRPAGDVARPRGLVPASRRSRQSRNQLVVFLNFCFSLLMLAVLAGGAAFYFGKRAFDGPGPSTTAETFLIKPNTGVQEIATQLERRNLISDARIFQAGVRAQGRGGTLKAGEYEIPAGASMREIMEVMESGKSVLYSVTIPEGLTVEQAMQRVASHEALTGEMPAEFPPEGSLAADTQRVTRGTPRQQVIDKMLADQKKLVDEIWARRDADLPISDRNEFVTLASIVEKETGRADERPHVASVFVNRLREGMRLQSDPTIVYGLFGGKGKPSDRPIYQSDIEKPTPYNTYVIDGLPPTAIANPGRAALEAVANPLKTDDLYFVADGTGGHVFATSLAEHNRNVARWRAAEKQRAAEKPVEAAQP